MDFSESLPKVGPTDEWSVIYFGFSDFGVDRAID